MAANKNYVVVYRITEAIVVSAPNPDKASTRAEAVLRAQGKEDVEIVRVTW